MRRAPTPTSKVSLLLVVFALFSSFLFLSNGRLVSSLDGDDENNNNSNRKLLQISRIGAPKRNKDRVLYSRQQGATRRSDFATPHGGEMVDDALLPALNSNPSVGSNVMSSVDDFEDYDKSQYYDDIFAEEKEEEKGGGSFSSDSASSLVLGEEEERSEEEGESSAFTSSASVLDDVVPASGDELETNSIEDTAEDEDDGVVTLRDGSKTTFWYKAAKKLGTNKSVRKFGTASAKFGMRVARSKPVQSTGRGFVNSHRKAKDTLRKTKLMRDASDRQVNQAILGIMAVILVCWMLFGIFVIVPARERRQREWAEKVES
jgi:hypothetical protein